MNNLCYTANQQNFNKIPGFVFAYWVSANLIGIFQKKKLIDFSVSPSQNITGNNEKFVRKVWEINDENVNKKDCWIFYAKGGDFRRWYGNLDNLVDWRPSARIIYENGDGKHASQIINKEYWYRKGITWGLITSAYPSFRVMPDGATFDKGGSTLIVKIDYYNYILGLLNSKVFLKISKIFNPTLNLQIKDVKNMPIVIDSKDEVELKVENNIEISKTDWDSFETSWDFKKHPLI